MPLQPLSEVLGRSIELGKEILLGPDSVYHDIVMYYTREVGITESTHGFCVHSLRATAATNALDNKADMPRYKSEWTLRHLNHCMYDKRRSKIEEIFSFKVKY